MSLETPVALVIFNRPETTSQVMARIAEARPRHLLIIADGPRTTVPTDPDRCASTRAAVEAQIDWPCVVFRNYSDVNLGCRRRVSSGLDWVFTLVPEAIVLEDDCLPAPEFFPYCAELLARYRNDKRIMCISGDNFQSVPPTEHSYYFSKHTHIWGWATWRRAWQLYDHAMKNWPAFRSAGMLRQWSEGSFAFQAYWTRMLDRTARGEIDTWDYPWTLSCWQHNGLTCLPRINLVSNIGGGSGATHTISAGPGLSLDNNPGALAWPLHHPPAVVRNVGADRYTDRHHFKISLIREVVKRVKALCRPARSVGGSARP